MIDFCTVHVHHQASQFYAEIRKQKDHNRRATASNVKICNAQRGTRPYSKQGAGMSTPAMLWQVSHECGGYGNRAISRERGLGWCGDRVASLTRLILRGLFLVTQGSTAPTEQCVVLLRSV
jgi:hypothetical protein